MQTSPKETPSHPGGPNQPQTDTDHQNRHNRHPHGLHPPKHRLDPRQHLRPQHHGHHNHPPLPRPPHPRHPPTNPTQPPHLLLPNPPPTNLRNLPPHLSNQRQNRRPLPPASSSSRRRHTRRHRSPPSNPQRRRSSRQQARLLPARHLPAQRHAGRPPRQPARRRGVDAAERDGGQVCGCQPATGNDSCWG